MQTNTNKCQDNRVYRKPKTSKIIHRHLIHPSTRPVSQFWNFEIDYTRRERRTALLRRLHTGLRRGRRWITVQHSAMKLMRNWVLAAEVDRGLVLFPLARLRCLKTGPINQTSGEDGAIWFDGERFAWYLGGREVGGSESIDIEELR